MRGEAATSERTPFLYRVRTFRALQYREFRYLWLGQLTTSLGTWMDQVARGWLLYQLTDSALQLGAIRAISALPFLVLSPIAGTLADHYDRKKLMTIAQLCNVGDYGLLAVLIISGVVEPWHVYATAIASSIVQVFQQPPRQAMVSDAVPSTILINAIGLNSMVFNVARSVGPAIAGLLIAIWDTGGAYVAQTGLYVAATLLTLPLHGGRPAAHAHRPFTARVVVESTLEGWRFAWRNDAVRPSFIVGMVSGLLVIPFTTLLPVFARDILVAGPTGQGLLLTAMGIGALGSATLIASLGDKLPRGLLMLGGVTMYGLAVAAFAASSSFQLSLFLMGVTGVFHVSSQALISTIIQAYSPSELRGRMMATWQQNQVFQTAGGMLCGSLASLWGAPWAIASMGLACSAGVLAIAATSEKARAIR